MADANEMHSFAQVDIMLETQLALSGCNALATTL